MSRNIVLELPDDQAQILDRVAAGLHKTPSEAAALLMDEAMRHELFPQVEFRESAMGRQACVAGSTLAVWEVVMVAESYEMDASRTAAHFNWPPARVEAVLAYAGSYPGEILSALAENRAVTPDVIGGKLPNARWA